MSKAINRQLKKFIAITTLSLMIVTMFCIGMFVPFIHTAMAAEVSSCGACVYDSASAYGLREAPLPVEIPSCCLGHNTGAKAVVISQSNDKTIVLFTPVILNNIELALPEVKANYNFLPIILPPPEGEAIKTIVKRE